MDGLPPLVAPASPVTAKGSAGAAVVAGLGLACAVLALAAGTLAASMVWDDARGNLVDVGDGLLRDLEPLRIVLRLVHGALQLEALSHLVRAIDDPAVEGELGLTAELAGVRIETDTDEFPGAHLGIEKLTEIPWTGHRLTSLLSGTQTPFQAGSLLMRAISKKPA